MYTDFSHYHLATLGDAPFKSDVRTIICFLHLEEVPGNDTHHQLCDVFREGNVMSKLVMPKISIIDIRELFNKERFL